MKINNIKNEKTEVGVDQLIQHPYHKEIYESTSSDYLEESVKRTGHKPVNPIIVVPNLTTETYKYYIVSGWVRFETLKKLGAKEVEVVVYHISDNTEIQNLIVDLNKARPKDGRIRLMEFRHYLELYPAKSGVVGYDRFEQIGKELGMKPRTAKSLNTLNNFYQGKGDELLIGYFDDKTSLDHLTNQKQIVSDNPEYFDSLDNWEILLNPDFKVEKIKDTIELCESTDPDEQTLVYDYMTNDDSPEEFSKSLGQMKRTKKRESDHQASKITIVIPDDQYVSNNTYLINGDNRDVEIVNPFDTPIRCIVGSPPYGNKRLNGDDVDNETGHNMTGQEYGIYLAETYEGYKSVLSPDGSIYVIIDDFKNDEGSHSCSIEHFVVEMTNRGYFLTGRYVWEKSNPIPRGYNSKEMVSSFEMLYKFTLHPTDYYVNKDFFIELEGFEGKFQPGATNTNNKGQTTRGGIYYQGHLKKIRNVLDNKNCMDIIKGNVANPETFFMTTDDKRHTSTCPPYLSSILILESTRPGDVVLDIWSGVGNTMNSCHLLQRKYIGIEKEKNYYEQTCRREQIVSLRQDEIYTGGQIF